MKTELTVQTAPSGEQYISMPIQSPALCDLQDQYGVCGYRPDYWNEIVSVRGLAGCIWVSDFKSGKMAEFIAQAIPLIESAHREYQEREDYFAAEDSRRDTQARAAENAWRQKYPHGRKIYFSAWGGDFVEPAYAIQKNIYDNPADVIAEAICRKNHLVAGSRVRSDGTALSHGKPTAQHYAFSMGYPCSGGGVNAEYQVWFSIPCAGGEK